MRRATARRLRAAARIRRRDPGHRAHPLHHLAPEGIHAAPDRRVRRDAASSCACAPAGAVGLGPRPGGDEARLHRARIQVDRAPAARGAPGHLASPRTSSSASPARPTPTSRRRMKLVDDVGFDDALQLSSTARGPARRRRSCRTTTPHEVKLARLQRLQALLEAQAQRDQRGHGRHAPARAGRRARRGRIPPSSPAAPRTTASSISPAAAALDRRASSTSRSPRALPAFAARRTRRLRASTPLEAPSKSRFTPVDNQRLANLCGALDENLRQIETALDVSIARRGERFALDRRARTDAARGAGAASASTQQADADLVGRRHPARADRGRAAARADAGDGRRQPRAASRAGADLHGRTPHQVAVPASTSRSTTSPSASARPAPARPTSPSPARSTRSSATR